MRRGVCIATILLLRLWQWLLHGELHLQFLAHPLIESSCLLQSRKHLTRNGVQCRCQVGEAFADLMMVGGEKGGMCAVFRRHFCDRIEYSLRHWRRGAVSVDGIRACCIFPLLLLLFLHPSSPLDDTASIHRCFTCQEALIEGLAHLNRFLQCATLIGMTHQ